MNKDCKSEYVEINISKILRQIWAKKIAIIIFTAFMTAGAYLVSAYVLTPVYQATTKMYILTQPDNKQVTTQDLQAGSYLIEDYKEIILSNNILEDVIDRKDLKLTPQELRKKIKINIPPSTRILTIEVKDKDPQQAKNLANSVREVGIDKIEEITKTHDITVLEKAQVPQKPIAPKVHKITLLTLGISLVVSVVSVGLAELFNNKVVVPEDIEDELQVPFLGYVPLHKRK
ncbi:YveK family protein [Ligilactobacillus ceti]|uniref:Capsular polysaccharide biosynthesis protein CpsC n=1 Tax=Ligilactobacillus ceti DSM 22408 TaxID=1122146 RepID=A0A0R2KG41_9LACO|nr:Wzz/FepE/Etk N-terminal domain-containing protein [Ligilactobacillus ceti]KRN88384.1 hypothetical protein IV53_GL000348 [Ligilactobacillus ceti DSM 22408]